MVFTAAVYHVFGLLFYCSIIHPLSADNYFTQLPITLSTPYHMLFAFGSSRYIIHKPKYSPTAFYIIYQSLLPDCLGHFSRITYMPANKWWRHFVLFHLLLSQVPTTYMNLNKTL